MSGANRYLAAGTLCVTSLLYFYALPFKSTFGGGLAVSVFGAAMVGGLADWFAVSALFRKPLGIPWRTAVIPRNRQRLFGVIVQMVQEDLLSKANIRRKIEEYDIPHAVLVYLDERGGAKTIKRMLHKLLSDVLDKVDADEAGRFIGRFLRHEDVMKLSPLVRSVGEWTVHSGYDQKVIHFAIGELSHVVATSEFRSLLVEFFQAALTQYEGDRRRRKLFDSVAGISPDTLATTVQQRLIEWLNCVKMTEHPLKAALRQRFSRYLQQLSQGGPAAEKIERWKDQLLNRLHISGLAKNAVHWLLRQAGDQQTARWFRQADRVVDQLLLDFRTNPHQQQYVSRAIKQYLLQFIDSHHDKIGELVYERLALFSDAELVDFIEAKIGEDLQIIRINGSIIGGLTGGIIYCATFWL